MEGGNVETPASLALQASRDATGGSSGKDILTRYRQLVAEKSASKSSTKKAPTPGKAGWSQDNKSKDEGKSVAEDLASEMNLNAGRPPKNTDKENVNPSKHAAIRKIMKSRVAKPQCAPPRRRLGSSREQQRAAFTSPRRKSAPVSISSPKPHASFSETAIDYASDSSAMANVSEDNAASLPPSSASKSEAQHQIISHDTEVGETMSTMNDLTDVRENSVWAMMGANGGERAGDGSAEQRLGDLSLPSPAEKVFEEDIQPEGHGGNSVDLEPAELLSFLGASFLNESLDVRGDRKSPDVGVPDGLSPLQECSASTGSEGYDRNDSDIGSKSDHSDDTFPAKNDDGTENGSVSSRDRFVKWTEAQDGGGVNESRIVSDDGELSSESGDSDEYLSQQYQTPHSKYATSAPSSMETLRSNAMQLALEESEAYMKKINELAAALEKSQADAAQEAKWRQEAETRMKKLLKQSAQKTHQMIQSCENESAQKTSEGGDVDESMMVSPLSNPSAMGSKKHDRDEGSSATLRLIERNKTLVKEVRFADQTCVELAEQNSSLRSEIDRLERALESSKEEHDLLRDGVMKATQHGAKMEASRDSLQDQLLEQKKVFESQKSTYAAHLADSQKQIESLCVRLEQSDADKSSLVTKLALSHEKTESNSAACALSNERVAALTERLATAEASATLLKDSLRAAQMQTNELQALCNETKEELCVERAARESISEERDSLEARCSELESQIAAFPDTSTPTESLCSPAKDLEVQSFSFRTPTSQVLAKTLRSELRRCHSAADRVVETERHVAELYAELQHVTRELEDSRADAVSAREKLQEDAKELKSALDTKRALALTVSCQQNSIKELEAQLEKNRKEPALQLTQLAEEIARAVPRENTERTSSQHLVKDVALSTVRTMMHSYGTMAETVEEKMCDHAKRVERLADTIRYLQQCFDFQSQHSEDANTTLQSTLDCGNSLSVQSGSDCFDGDDSSQSERATGEAAPEREEDDNVLNATFAEGPQNSENVMVLMEEARPDDEKDSESCKIGDEHASDHLTHMSQYTASKMAQLREELRVADESLRRLENEKDSILQLRGEANAELEEARVALSRLEQENTKLHDTVANLTSQIEKYETDLSALSEVAGKDKDRYQNELKQSDRLVADLKAQLQECQGQLDKSEREKAESAEEMVSDNNALIEDIAKLKIELEEQQLKIENNQIVLKAVRNESENYCQDAKNAYAAFQTSSEEARELKDTVGKMRSEVDCLSKVVAELETEVQERTAELKDAEDRAQDADKQRLEFKQTCSALRAQVKEIEKANEEALCALNQKLQRAQETVANDISSLQNDLALKEEECVSTRNRCKDLEKHVEGLEALRESNGQKIDELTSEIDGLKSSYLECNDKLANAMEKKIESESLLEELRTSLHDTKTELDNTQKLLSDAHDEVEEYSKQCVDLQEMNSTTLRELEQCKCDAMIRSNEKDSRIKMLETANKERQEVFDEQLSKMAHDRDNHVRRVEAMVDTLRSELDAAKKNAQKAEDDANAAAQDLQQNLSNVQDEVRHCRASIAVLNAEVSQQNVVIKDAELDRERLEEELAQQIERCDSLDADIEAKRVKAAQLEEELKRSLKDIEASASKNASTQSALDKSEKSRMLIERELSSALEDFERLKGRHREEESRMQKSLSELSKARDSTKAQLAEKETEVARLTKEQEAAANGLRLENSRLEKKCVKLRECIKRLTEKCNYWSANYEDEKTARAEAEGNHELALEKLSGLEAQIDALKEASNRDRQGWSRERKHLEMIISRIKDEVASPQLNYMRVVSNVDQRNVVSHGYGGLSSADRKIHSLIKDAGRTTEYVQNDIDKLIDSASNSDTMTSWRQRSPYSNEFSTGGNISTTRNASRSTTKDSWDESCL